MLDIIITAADIIITTFCILGFVFTMKFYGGFNMAGVANVFYMNNVWYHYQLGAINLLQTVFLTIMLLLVGYLLIYIGMAIYGTVTIASTVIAFVMFLFK